MAKQKKTTNNKNKNKKNTQNSKEVLKNFDNDNNAKKIIKCIVIVLVFFAVMYLLTVLILKKSSTDYITNEKDSTSIQYSEILAGTSFSKKDNEYLVLFYNMNDDEDNDNIYSNLVSDYEAKDEHLPIYYVDLSSTLNKSVLSKESNKDATSAEELKINGVTLIKFTNNKISEYIEGQEEISNYLK